MPRRPPNAELRTRGHLTVADVGAILMNSWVTPGSGLLRDPL
jgi:hypothetical protein